MIESFGSNQILFFLLLMTVTAIFAGFFAGFFGIGGGSLTVPFLISCKEKMRSAVACSVACSLPISFFGALTYLWQGWPSDNLPAYSTGYIYWPATFCILLMSFPFAKLGVFLSTKISENKLKRSFSFILLFILKILNNMSVNAM